MPAYPLLSAVPEDGFENVEYPLLPAVPEDGFENESADLSDTEDVNKFIDKIRIILKSYIDKDMFIEILSVKPKSIIPRDIMTKINSIILNEINFTYNFIINPSFKPSREIVKTIQDNFFDDLRVKYPYD